MKNLLSIFVLVFLTLNVLAQESENYAIYKDGKRIELIGKVGVSLWEVSHHPVNEKGKSKYTIIKQANLKLLVVGSQVWVRYDDHTKRASKHALAKLLAFNGKYAMLGGTYGSKNFDGTNKDGFKTYLKITDMDYKLIEKVTFSVGKKKIDENKEKFKRIDFFFNNCPQVIKKMKRNMMVGAGLDSDISNYKCGSTKELFPEVSRPQIEDESDKSYSLPESVSEITENYWMYKTDEKGPLGVTQQPKRMSKYKSYSQKFLDDLKYIVYGGKLYMKFVIEDDINDIMEVMAYNEKYILTNDFSEKYTYNVYGRDYKIVERKIGKKEIVKVLSKYFKDCPDLIKKIEENKVLSKEESYYNCGNASPLTR